MTTKHPRNHNARRGWLQRLIPQRLIPVALSCVVTVLSMPAQGTIALPNVPLFTTSAGKANVLMVLDNSNSMDEFPSGAAAGSDNPDSKSEIARGVIKKLVTDYTGKLNMGLMSYQQNDPAESYLHNSPYDLSYNPANYDPTFSGPRESTTKRYRMPNPVSAGEYIYYNVALPFYSSNNEGKLFCYSGGSGFPAGPNQPYKCYSTKTGPSDAAPGTSGAGYSGSAGTFSFFPTDSDYAQGISSFGQRMAWDFVARTWYRNDSPGRGYLNVAVQDLDATQAAKITTKLACNIPGTPGSCTSAGLKNAGLTPIEGTLLTAKDYFDGNLSKSSEGYTSSTYPLPTTCKKNYVILLTDGLPSTDKNGDIITDPAKGISQAAAAAAALYADGTETYVVGFALPYGTDPTSLDKIAAAGGTGTAYNASDSATLDAALATIFKDIALKSGSGGAVASNSTRLDTDTQVFKASFNPGAWSGELGAYAVTASGANPVPSWQASALIPAAGARNILTWDGSVGAVFPTAAQTTALTAPVAAYIRGDRTGEGSTYRKRDSLLGDIVHSSPVYEKDTDTVYVGANDGMLHAFDAKTGIEQFAYVPGALSMAALKTLSDPSYSHRYFVDGELAVSSKAQTPGKHILVGLLGNGGKSVYALDVTDPATMGMTKVLWEYSDTELGNALGKPIVAKLNNGKTVVMFGNGYNSASEHAVLYILDIETGALIAKLDTGKGSSALPNGMATPVGWDDDNSGTVDSIYAGDLLGNVWKFDVSAKNPMSWDAAFKAAGKPAPFFIAKDSGGKTQPITGSMSMGLDPTTFNRWLFFGTGRYLTTTDITNKDVQSWYGLIDDGTQITARSELKQRRIVVQTTASGKTVRAFEKATAGDMSGKRGWYVDLVLPGDVAEGERIVSDSTLYGSVLLAASIIPTSAACDVGGRGFINAIDPFTGGSVSSPFFDTNGDGQFNDADKVSDGSQLLPVGSVDLGVGMPTTPNIIQSILIAGGSGGGIGGIGVANPITQGRISWREILKD